MKTLTIQREHNIFLARTSYGYVSLCTRKTGIKRWPFLEKLDHRESIDVTLAPTCNCHKCKN